MPNVRFSEVAHAILVAYAEEFKDAETGKPPIGTLASNLVIRYLFPHLSKTKQAELERKYPVITHFKD